MYKVHIGYTKTGRDRWVKFASLAAANEFCEKVRQETRIILTIIKESR